MTDKRKRPSRRQALRALGKPKLTPQQQLVATLATATTCRRLTAAELELMRTPEEIAAEIRWARQLLATVDELAAHRESGGSVN
jgi:hypothetical protein